MTREIGSFCWSTVVSSGRSALNPELNRFFCCMLKKAEALCAVVDLPVHLRRGIPQERPIDRERAVGVARAGDEALDLLIAERAPEPEPVAQDRPADVEAAVEVGLEVAGAIDAAGAKVGVDVVRLDACRCRSRCCRCRGRDWCPNAAPC